MGKIFGSREIEKITHDRFYDDEDKIWYVIEDRAAASVKKDIIKNFWAEDDELADAVLKEIVSRENIKGGVLPAVFQDIYRVNGFSVSEYSRNFVEVTYEKD
ncbi:MAG: hypothetical protein IJC48_03510 [Clostridia bacterium]|nr:hypothetical protein [Clostridia bacterium]MBQ4159128.1 hypothetical protein [Clostridia bacterium]